MSKLGCCDKGTVAGKDSVLCTQDSVAPRARFARLQAPRQIHHLNVLAGAPYDDAAFVER